MDCVRSGNAHEQMAPRYSAVACLTVETFKTKTVTIAMRHLLRFPKPCKLKRGGLWADGPQGEAWVWTFSCPKIHALIFFLKLLRAYSQHFSWASALGIELRGITLRSFTAGPEWPRQSISSYYLVLSPLDFQNMWMPIWKLTIIHSFFIPPFFFAYFLCFFASILSLIKKLKMQVELELIFIKKNLKPSSNGSRPCKARAISRKRRTVLPTGTRMPFDTTSLFCEQQWRRNRS